MTHLSITIQIQNNHKIIVTSSLLINSVQKKNIDHKKLIIFKRIKLIFRSLSYRYTDRKYIPYNNLYSY